MLINGGFPKAVISLYRCHDLCAGVWRRGAAGGVPAWRAARGGRAGLAGRAAAPPATAAAAGPTRFGYV